MRALQVTQLTGPDGVRLVDVPEPSDADRIVLRVHAVGLSFPDVLRSKGQYQQQATPPYTLGGEAAGVVISAPLESGFVLAIAWPARVPLPPRSSPSCTPATQSVCPSRCRSRKAPRCR